MCTQKIEVVEWYLPECIFDSKVNRQQLPEKKHIFCFTYYIYISDEGDSRWSLFFDHELHREFLLVTMLFFRQK